MIITAPTGLYKGVLPAGDEAGNVTYTISSQSPPRANVTVLQLPVSEEFGAAPDKIFDDDERRAQFGELIFSVVQSNKGLLGSNAKAFEVGEILNFEVLPPIEELVTVRAPEDIEIQHNTNMLNLANLNLTEEEIAQLEAQSETKQRELEAQFAQKQDELKSLDVDIREKQKTINENNKALNAVRTILGVPDGQTSDDPIFQKLSANEALFQEELEALISDRNLVAQEVADVSKEVFRISELVR
jgi:hypothetical protein